MTCRTDRYSGVTAEAQRKYCSMFALPVGADHWLDTPYSPTTARGVLSRLRSRCRARRSSASDANFRRSVNESSKNDVVINVGGQSSKIAEGSSLFKVSWSLLSDVVTRGQPSRFGSSELEDGHRIRVS
ncbi:unnamed protein product [Heligmosomoides polygyrus]|uniref:Uncharacterized protein n=1 Tax=Heligmosomoides polygyrus TaxID=6339 RepID=A0A3P8BC17_HELPZ|nr:unnamed protein product [Heligmosomoides polygyrus]